MQNNFAKSVAAPYSVRPHEGAAPGLPPLPKMDCLRSKKGLDSAHFTIKSVLKRFKKVGDLFKALCPGQGQVNIKAIFKTFKIQSRPIDLYSSPLQNC